MGNWNWIYSNRWRFPAVEWTSNHVFCAKVGDWRTPTMGRRYHW